MLDWSNFENKLHERDRRAEISRQNGISTCNIRDWFNPDKSAQPCTEELVKISKALGRVLPMQSNTKCIKRYLNT